jgi:uncharacterized phage protein (TIGR02218 family)
MKTTNVTLDAALALNVHKLADLYTIEFREGTVRWTSADLNVTDGVNTWLAAGATVPLISRGNSKASAGLSVDSLEVTIAPGASTLGGLSLKLAAIQGSFDNVRVLVERAYMSTWGTAANLKVVVFDGLVVDVAPGSTEIVLSVKSALNKLNEQIPKRLIQPQCPYRVFDTQCGLTAATWTDSAKTVAAGTTASVIQLNASSTTANVGGYVRVTSGTLNGTYRTIKAVAGAAVTLNMPLPSIPATGVTLSIVKGCDKTRVACRAFSNIQNYGGYPDAPRADSEAK